LQDIKELDSRGIPGGFIASAVFENAAKAHAEAVGFSADSLFVAHPIQDRTDEEMKSLAEEAFERAVSLVCSD
jgi:hypothetical protein